MARDLLTSSPYQPYARAVLIDKAWDHVKDKVPEWEKESGNTPALLAALARRYIGAKQYEDAERIVASYIDISPDGGAFRLFASTYKAQGKMDRWLETLEASLKAEDFGLDHARARVEIADYYMGLKAVGQSQALRRRSGGDVGRVGDELLPAGAPRERKPGGVPKSGSSEKPSATPAQPGRSGISSASAQATATSPRHARPSSSTSPTRPINATSRTRNTRAVSTGSKVRPTRPRANSRAPTRTRTSISAALCLAMVLDDEKNAGKRDELVNELVARHGDKAPKSIAICRLFLDSILAPDGTKKPLDLVALDGIISSIPEENRVNTEFFAAWFLKNHGHRDQARKYLEHCASSRTILSWYWFLAKDALKRLAETGAPTKGDRS